MLMWRRPCESREEHTEQEDMEEEVEEAEEDHVYGRLHIILEMKECDL